MKRLKNELSLSFSSIDKNTRLIMAEGALASMVINLTNPFYQLFAKQMGAGDFAIGLINSLPALCALFVLLPMSCYTDTVADKKKFVSKTILACGIVFPIVACAPFMGAWGVWLFILGISIFNIPYIFYTVSWQSYFSDLYDPRRRSLPYSMRHAVTNLAPAATVLICSLILSSFCPSGESKLIAYQIFFVLAFVCAILQKRTLDKTVCENPQRPQPKKTAAQLMGTFTQSFKELRKNPQYTFFLLLLLFFYLSWQMAWPLFFINLMDFQGFTPSMKLISDVVSWICIAITATWWGKYIQRKGSRPATIMGLFCCATSPAWAVAFPGFVNILLNYGINGFFSPAFQLGFFNEMLDLIPEENKSLNIGIYNTILQVSGFIAPLIGVAVYKMIGMNATMYLSSSLRFIAASCFLIRHLILKRRMPVTAASE